MILLVVIVVLFAVLLINNTSAEEPTVQTLKITETYNPLINPNDFVSKINNKYLTLTPGTKYIFKGETEEGTERIEVYVSHDTKKVMGVKTIVVQDKEWLNGELIEDTKDWFAQDKFGNVWYFGEDSKDFVLGKLVSTKGSWQAGINGALPGIIMKANPKVGDTYVQEYFPGEAEDMAEIVALGVGIKVKYGSFTDCLQTRDWNPLEPGDDEYKYYCPKVGLVYEIGIEDGESVQLIAIEKDSIKKKPVKVVEEPVVVLKRDITEEEAIEIAQERVEGRVTDVEIEKKFGKATYVVEIDGNRGETDVIIDIETGEILGIET